MHELEVTNLKKYFGENLLFDGISFTVDKGEVVAIIGDSGSGKTTILHCISFLENLDDGQIKIEHHNIDIKNATKKDLNNFIKKTRPKIGIVFQDFNLWPHMSVLENIIEAPINVNHELTDDAKKRALVMLKDFGLETKALCMPDNLSGGQKQRVAIIRTLMMKPNIMLFDEPTSALDPNMVSNLIKIIKKLSSQQISVIVATHEIPFAKQVADKVIFIANKSIIEQGSTAILKNPKSQLLRRFLNI